MLNVQMFFICENVMYLFCRHVVQISSIVKKFINGLWFLTSKKRLSDRDCHCPQLEKTSTYLQFLLFSSVPCVGVEVDRTAV